MIVAVLIFFKQHIKRSFKPPPLIRRADIEKMTERLDSVLTGSQSSRTDFQNEYSIRFLDIHFRAF